jgi:hypothetical protein
LRQLRNGNGAGFARFPTLFVRSELGFTSLLVVPFAGDATSTAEGRMSVPFAWQDKRVLRKIRQLVPDCGTGVAVYVALTECASDQAAEEFQTTHEWLAKFSGLSKKTVWSRLQELKEIGVIDFSTPAMRGPCTYRLLPFGNGDVAQSNGCRALRNRISVPLRRSEETKETKRATKTLTTSERISAEQELRRLQQRKRELEEDTSEPWQVQACPELVSEKRQVKAKIETLNETLATA